MSGEERKSALTELIAFSGILKSSELLNLKLKEFPMLDIDLSENAVVRPLIETGRQEGRQELLIAQLAEKFGALPNWVAERVHSAVPEQLDRWALRIIRASSLDETFS